MTPPDATSPVDAGITETSSSETGAADAGDPAALLAAHNAADRAFEATMLAFWSGDAAYLREKPDLGSDVTGYWIFAQAFDAVLDNAARTGRYGGLIETFYLAQEARGWARDFYDDENWMALALLRAYDLTAKSKYLTRARQLLDDIVDTAQDATCCGAAKGGLWWDKPHTQKATAINGGAVVTAVRMYERTNDTKYLDFAKKVLDFWHTNMVDPVSHRVFDHVKAPGGEVVKYDFTYNEGIMIGASLALYAVTKDAKYRAWAHETADWMVKEQTKTAAQGPVLDDGDDQSCTGDCPQFKGIGYRWLAALHAADPKPAYDAILRASAASMLANARDAKSGLFGIDWTKAPGNLVVEANTSAAMSLSIFASSLGNDPRPRTPLVLEAEEGVLHGLGLEARSTGFQGWGYVAGWNKDGQWVDFEVKAPPGQYTLTFRYAAGAGDASRLVHVNGVDAIPNQAFPSTGAWETYRTVDVTVTLPATSTISLVYNGGKGSKNFLNLDRLTLTAK